MKLLKKINNNYALALDSSGEQIIVEGKGVGFMKMPCEIKDLSLISRTYYDIKEQDVELLKSLSDDVLLVSSKVCTYANKLISEKINPNLLFVLADHIQFCIERYEKQIVIEMPLLYDINFLYPTESKIADYAMKLIEEELKIQLPENEKTGIAFNIINSEIVIDTHKSINTNIIKICTDIIEKNMNITVHKESFSYSRFVTHLEYLIRRIDEAVLKKEENRDMYLTLCEKYPKVAICVGEIAEVFRLEGYRLNEDEKLYLMMHINRLCAREDCNS